MLKSLQASRGPKLPPTSVSYTFVRCPKPFSHQNSSLAWRTIWLTVTPVSRAGAAPALSWHLHWAVGHLPYVWSGSSPTETVPCLPHWVPSTLLIHPLQCSVCVSKKQFSLSGDLTEKYNSMKWSQPTFSVPSPVSPDRSCCPSLNTPHTHFQSLMNNNNE